MDHLEGVRAIEERGLKGEGVVLLLGEEVSLVLVLNLLAAAHLRELIVGHVEVFATLELLVVEASSGRSGRVRLLVADESADTLRSAVFRSTLDDLDALNLTTLSE